MRLRLATKQINSLTSDLERASIAIVSTCCHDRDLHAQERKNCIRKRKRNAGLTKLPDFVGTTYDFSGICGVDEARTRDLLRDRNIRAAKAFQKRRFLFDFAENILLTDTLLSQNVYQYRHIIATGLLPKNAPIVVLCRWLEGQPQRSLSAVTDLKKSPDHRSKAERLVMYGITSCFA